MSSECYTLKESTWLRVEYGGIDKRVPLDHGTAKPCLDSGEIHVARPTGGTGSQGEVCRCVETEVLRAPAVGASPSCSMWNTFVEWEHPFYLC